MVGGYWIGGQADQTIYFYEGVTGFTTPTWEGVNCVEIPVSTPSAPTELAAMTGNGYVMLNWTAPESDGGAPIDHYTIYENGEQIAQTTGLRFNVTGLTNGQTYVFSVAAHSQAGNGDNATVSATPCIFAVRVLTPINGSCTNGTNVCILMVDRAGRCHRRDGPGPGGRQLDGRDGDQL